MYRGRIVAEMDGRTADRGEVGLLMATGGRDPAALRSAGVTIDSEPVREVRP
jgi:hypothetical protein